MDDYFVSLKSLHPRKLLEVFDSKSHLPMLEMWEINNEIKPVDLYCYLHAKYGAANGIQNFLRKDDSDNLIHWEWTLVNEDGMISIQGHNFRTEVHTFRRLGIGLTKEDFIQQTKRDFSNYGKEMRSVRLDLEKWSHFINPYRRIERVIDRHVQTLVDLDLDLERDKLSQPRTFQEMQDFSEAMKKVSDRYTQALGIAFGVRAMLPVLAESFINFLIFALSKPEIKSSKRLLEEALRRPIDVRVQTLHLYCVGFSAPVNYADKRCKDFHSLMNERNDMLHGNIDVGRQSFEEIHFNGRVPIFTSYGSFWDKSIGVEARSIRLDDIQDDRSIVEEFKRYVLSLLNDKTRVSIERMLSEPHLGFDARRGILGVLLPTHMVDARMGGGSDKNRDSKDVGESEG